MYYSITLEKGYPSFATIFREGSWDWLWIKILTKTAQDRTVPRSNAQSNWLWNNTFKANKYKSFCWLSTQRRTNRNLLLITLPQKYDYVPAQASNEPTIHQPRDSSLWPYNNYPSRFWQSAMYQFQMWLVQPQGKTNVWDNEITRQNMKCQTLNVLSRYCV